MPVDPSILLEFASGVPLVVTGIGLLAVTPRSRDQILFSLFAGVWGVQILAANLGGLLGAGPGVYHTALLLDYALLVVAGLLLARFAGLAGPRWAQKPVLYLYAGLGCVAGLTFAVAPRAFVAAVEVTPAVTTITLGPAALALAIAPFYLAFFSAVVLLYLRYRAADPGTPRHRARGLLMALALFPCYATVRNLIVFLDPAFPVGVLGPLGRWGYVGLFAGGTVVLAGVALHALVDPPAPEDADPLLVGAFALPLVVPVLELGLARVGPTVELLGVFRFATVGVLAYTLARHQLFDLDLRVKPVVGAAAAALAVTAGAVVTVLQFVDGVRGVQVAVPFLVGTTVAGAAWSTRDRLGDRLFPDADPSTAYVRQRKLDVYRQSLQDAVRQGRPLDGPDLAERRRELGITDREHEVMTYLLAKDATSGERDRVRVEPGATLADRYRIERLIGEGSHGRVHEAWDRVAKRRVAVKAVGRMLYGGEAAERLLAEAKLVADLDHPHVVRLHDVVEGRHEVVLVMEYAEEGSLRGLLDRRGSLGRRRALELVDQVLDGLTAAHDRGIVHRDVKPENVLLGSGGQAKVADFGVARRVGPEATGLTGGAIGTLLYMSPEQVRGDAVDARADLYAAGVVLHELLTGRYVLPLAGRDDFQVRQAILEEAPSLDVGDEGLADVLERALAKDPADRFASAGAMREALAGLDR